MNIQSITKLDNILEMLNQLILTAANSQILSLFLPLSVHQCKEHNSKRLLEPQGDLTLYVSVLVYFFLSGLQNIKHKA